MSEEPLAAQSTSDKTLGGKPRPFTILTILAAVHAALGFAYFKPSSVFQLAAALVVSVGMVYFFWKQNIWAKRLVLITAVITFVADIPAFFTLPTFGQAVMGVDLALAGFLLYRLNTGAAKGYFEVARSKNDSQQVT